MPLIAYVATKTTTGSENYRKTLDKFGYDSIQIGLGEQWGGWRYRMKKYMDFCASRNPEEILILTDADDVLAIRPNHEKELMQTYQNFQRSIVVSAERYCEPLNCHPVPRYWTNRGLPDAQSIFVNAGTMMGPAGKLTDMWTWMLASAHTDDQYALGAYVDLYPETFALDTQNEIFYCHVHHFPAYEVPQIEWEGSAIKSITDSVNQRKIEPYFVHFAGNFVFPGLVANILGTTPKVAYNDYARGILGNEALSFFQSNGTAIQVTSIIFWAVVTLTIVFGLIAVILTFHLVKKSRLARDKHQANVSMVDRFQY